MASDKNVVLLYKSIAYFLKEEVESGKYSSEINESLEVAKQCIESAFHFTADGLEVVPDLLRSFYRSDESSGSSHSIPEPSEKEKHEAEELKTKGNNCMGKNEVDQAVAHYSEAIRLWPGNAVYYCNRAAAYCRLEKYDKAIDDCRTAIRIDPKYVKAYGRMGVAYSSLGNYSQAAEAYRKGLELDPTNESCQQNLRLVEEKLRASGGSGAPSGPGGFDLGSLLNNPMMQSMACQLMRDPNTQNLMSSLFRDSFGASGAGSTEPGSAAPQDPQSNDANSAPPPPAGGAGGNMDQFLRVCQQLGQQLRDNNPQLIDQFRQSFMNPQGPHPPGGDGAHAP